MELVDLIINNRHQTGNSYVSAEQERKTIKLVDIEDAVKLVTDTLIGFYSEQTGNWSRWNYCSKSDLQWIAHSQTLDYETNLSTIKASIEEYGEFSCSGGLPPKYEITVKKVGTHFEVEIVTFVHISISSDMFSWFDEESMKAALIKKMEYINRK